MSNFREWMLSSIGGDFAFGKIAKISLFNDIRLSIQHNYQPV